MNFTQDQIAAIIGSKELESIALRIQLAQALEKLKNLEELKVKKSKVKTKCLDPVS